MQVDQLVRTGTPWEMYHINGVPVHVKREDLSCPHPGPGFSKIRGLKVWLDELPKSTPIGVLDTYHSKGGWGMAYLCQAMGRPCHVFYPSYVKEPTLRYQQVMAKDLGAELHPLPAGRSAILYHTAKKMLAQLTDGIGVMVPNALKVQHSVNETALEVVTTTPDELLAGTWVASISSGTLAAGVLKVVAEFGVEFIAHMGYSRSHESAINYMTTMAGVNYPITLIDENYEYKDSVSNDDIPFPCNPYYDAKAWKWLVSNVHNLIQPVIFWNIGC